MKVFTTNQRELNDKLSLYGALYYYNNNKKTQTPKKSVKK